MTVSEHRRSDGTVVREHERKIKGRRKEGLTTGQAVGAAIAIGLAGMAGFKFVKLLEKMHGIRVIKPISVPPPSPRTFDPPGFPGWGNIENIASAGGLKKLTSLDAAPTSGHGYFTRSATMGLEGPNYQTTLRNVEKFIKGKPVEHGFVIDEFTGRILAGFVETRIACLSRFLPRKVFDLRRKLWRIHLPSSSLTAIQDTLPCLAKMC